MSIVIERRPTEAPAPWDAPTIPAHRFFDSPQVIPTFDTGRYLTIELERFDDVDVRRVYDRTTGTYGTLVTARPGRPAPLPR